MEFPGLLNWRCVYKEEDGIGEEIFREVTENYCVDRRENVMVRNVNEEKVDISDEIITEEIHDTENVWLKPDYKINGDEDLHPKRDELSRTC